MSIPSQISAASVQAWADQLPYANKTLVVQETFEVLRRIGEQELAPKQQLKAIESLHSAVEVALDHVKTRLASGHGATEQVLAAGETYCETLVDLCQNLADATGTSGGLLPAGRAAHRATVLAARYLEQWLLLRALDHRPAPPGLWQRARELDKRQRRRNAGSLARMVGLHLASTHRLNTRQIQDLAALLDQIPAGRLIALLPPSPTNGGDHGFFLPAGDCPPEFGPVPWGATPVSLDRLTAFLRTSPPPGFDPRLTRTLLQRWDGERQPKAKRTATHRPIKTTAVIGLGGIIRHLSDLNPTFGMHEMDAFEADDSGFGQDSTLFAEHQDTTQVSFVDFSDGGCRLRTSWSGVQTGDIIAVFWGHVEWRLGSVVWMSRRGDGLECGVQWLLKHPETVALRFDSGETVRAIAGSCLLDGKTGLLYCARSGHSGGPCLMNDGGAWRAIDLSISKHTGLVELARALPAREPVAAAADRKTPHNTGHADTTKASDELWPAFSVFGRTASTT